MSKGLIALVVVLLIVGFVFMQFIGIRNTLVQKDQDVQGAFSTVDIAMQRRADLIPNLVETVKGFAKQEVTVFGDIAKARSALLGAQIPEDKMAANGQLTNALGHLLSLQENYPQLKSNEQFLRLQDELAGSENRISVERNKYNDVVRDYNTTVQQFPGSIVAGMSGYAVKLYFKADEGSKIVPKVSFGDAAK